MPMAAGGRPAASGSDVIDFPSQGEPFFSGKENLEMLEMPYLYVSQEIMTGLIRGNMTLPRIKSRAGIPNSNPYRPG